MTFLGSRLPRLQLLSLTLLLLLRRNLPLLSLASTWPLTSTRRTYTLSVALPALGARHADIDVHLPLLLFSGF